MNAVTALMRLAKFELSGIRLVAYSIGSNGNAKPSRIASSDTGTVIIAAIEPAADQATPKQVALRQ